MLESFNINSQNSAFSILNQDTNTINHIQHNDLTCIITCVNYSDILKYTLPDNSKILKNIIIVTDTNDRDTVDICNKLNIKYIRTDIFYEKESIKFNYWSDMLSLPWWNKIYQYYFNKKRSFNKSKAINYTIKNYINTDWILLIDADIILSENLKYTNLNELDKDYLYSTYRIIYKTKQDWINKQNSILDSWQFVGFFQLFNKKSNNFFKNYYGYDEEFNYANSSDYFFMKKWGIQKKLLNFPVIHLGETERNWQGRVTELWD